MNGKRLWETIDCASQRVIWRKPQRPEVWEFNEHSHQRSPTQRSQTTPHRGGREVRQAPIRDRSSRKLANETPMLEPRAQADRFGKP